MKNKKLLWLPVVLLLVLTMGVFTACQWGITDEPEPSESQSQIEPTQPEPTETATVDTEPMETQPEETQPEETQPEETTDTGSGGPNVNTGTGGGYDPGENQPESTEPGTTEPEEDVTEPELEIPPAGSEANPYYEYIQNGAGEFTTVKIPAGATVYYRIRTAGTFLLVESEDVSVIYEESTQETRDGLGQLELPADDSEVISLAFTNNSDQDQNFPVAVVGPVGSASNPIKAETLDGLCAALEKDNVDGAYYQWIADRDGMLKLWAESSKDVDINLFVNKKAVQPTKDNGGKLCVQVKTEDVIYVHLLAKSDSEGNIPAAEVKLSGYIAQMVELSVTDVPFEAEPVTIEAGKSAYYTVTGAKGTLLQLAAEKAQIYYGAETLLPDENGVISLAITRNTVQIEVCNTDSQENSYVVQINYPVGHKLNPQPLTQLGDEIDTKTLAANGGYYYSYTAPCSGEVSFQIWTAPENTDWISKILLTNNTTGATAEITGIDGTASVQVFLGDQLSICVTVEDSLGAGMDSQLVILGKHYGTEEEPIVVEYPGFIADVPAGQTLYYQCYNMGGIVFSLHANDVTVQHNDKNYTGDEISFNVVSESRKPAVFVITNTGTADAKYEVTLSYPLGWRENPAVLVMGTNSCTRKRGEADYYFTYTATESGVLILEFSTTKQWTYTINNITKGVYYETQWSDSDPVVSRPEIQVSANDEIQIIVNTYNKNSIFTNPAGTVTFQASFVDNTVTLVDSAEE